MSKLAILKELGDLKALATRRSFLTRGGLVLAALYLVFGYGRDGMSYLSTATRMVSEKVRSSVPMEFELERARTMIEDLIPDVRENMLVIAQEEVAIEDLRRDVGRNDVELTKQRDEMIRIRAEIDKPATVRFASRLATSTEVKDELARRFSHYQVAEATLASKKQLLDAREKSLHAARNKLESILNAKRNLEVQVVNLQARLKTQQTNSAAGGIQIDDSQLARCHSLVDQLRVRLEVADRLLASDGTVSDLSSVVITSPSNDDIGQQIDRYFATGKPAALADVRK